jgi:hypothetical protein
LSLSGRRNTLLIRTTSVIVAVLIAVSIPAAYAVHDGDDVGGKLDLRRLVADKEFPGGPLTVTVATWLPWMDSVLRPSANNRLRLRLDSDGDGHADATARVRYAHGALIVDISVAGTVTDIVPGERPNGRAVSFSIPPGTANPVGDLNVAASSVFRSGDRCQPACRDRVPDAGWVEVAAADDGFVCTEVIGFSQTRQWFLDAPDFEAVVGSSGWQLLWNGGASIDRWADPRYRGWEEPIASACTQGSDAPDRVVLTISGEFEDDPDVWAEDIAAAIDTLRAKLPGVRQVVLQPVVGGPGDGTCQHEGELVRASSNHPVIDEAITRVMGGDVVAGASPVVFSCSDYADSKGHLVADARGPIGAAIGAFYGSG